MSTTPLAEMNGSASHSVSFFRGTCWVLLLALVLRIGCLILNPMIGADSLYFLQTARHFSNGEWEQALIHPYHPLTSLLVSLADKVHNSPYLKRA